jgi:hypothetical protein
MGAIQNLLVEVPLSAVLKERVALAEQKYEGAIRENADIKQRLQVLEQENVALRAQIPKQWNDGLDADTAQVLVHLFRAEGVDRDVGITARTLQMEKGIVKYHLGLLKDVGFAAVTSVNYVTGHVYWSLTPAGRKHAVEKKLI